MLREEEEKNAIYLLVKYERGRIKREYIFFINIYNSFKNGLLKIQKSFGNFNIQKKMNLCY